MSERESFALEEWEDVLNERNNKHSSDDENEGANSDDDYDGVIDTDTARVRSRHGHGHGHGHAAAPDDDDRPINEEDDDEEEEGEAAWDEPGAATVQADCCGDVVRHEARGNTSILFYAIMLLLVGGSLLYILYAPSLDNYNPDDVVMEKRIDYYAELQVSRDADASTINKAFRTIALQLHPDKNPGCSTCVERFQRVKKAHEILSSAEKRKMYDAMDISYEKLKSDALELTSGNFAHVFNHDDVWVLQAYSDWHKSCIAFSNVWESALQKHGGLMHFARVHIRERAILKQLGINTAQLPAVVICSRSRCSDAKIFVDGSRNNHVKFTHFIDAHYPSNIEKVTASRNAIGKFMQAATEHTASFVLFPNVAKKTSKSYDVNAPTLAYKSVARQYHSSFVFGQVNIDESMSQSKMLDLASSISKHYSLSAPKQLPAFLYRTSNETKPLWFMGNIDKVKLKSHVNTIQRQLVPAMTSSFFHRHCVSMRFENTYVQNYAHDAYACIIALACDELKIVKELQFNAFISGAKTTLKSKSIRALNSQYPKFQFATLDVTQHSDMKPLCSVLQRHNLSLNDLHIIGVQDNQVSVYPASGKQQQTHDFEAWLQNVASQDTSLEYDALPTLVMDHVHPDELRIGPVSIQFQYLYLAAIVVAAYFALPLIKTHLKTFVFLIFVSSVFFPLIEFFARQNGMYT